MRLVSNQFEDEVAFDVFDGSSSSSSSAEIDSWGKYAVGAAWVLRRSGHVLKRGIRGAVFAKYKLDGCGLGSSAALGIAFLVAFESANGISSLSGTFLKLQSQ